MNSPSMQVISGNPRFDDFYPPIAGTRTMRIGLFDVSSIVDVNSFPNPGIDHLLIDTKKAIKGDKVSFTAPEELLARYYVLPPNQYPEHWSPRDFAQLRATAEDIIETGKVAQATFSPGGTAVNVGYMIDQLLGPKVDQYFFGLTGNAGGKFDAISKEACRQSHIKPVIDLGDHIWPESVSYVIKYPGDRIIGKSSKDPKQFLTPDLFDRPYFEECFRSLHVVVIAGNLEAVVPAFADRLFDRLSQSGTTFIYMLPTNRAWSRENSVKIRNHMRDADLVLANAEEFVAGLGKNIDVKDLPAAARQQIMYATFNEAKEMFAARDVRWRSHRFLHRQNAMVTDGDKGAYGIDEFGVGHFPAFLTEVVSTSGAGDATFGAKASGCMSGVSIGGSIIGAQRIGSLKVGHDGARLPDALAALRAADPELALPFDEIREAMRTGHMPFGHHSATGWANVAAAPAYAPR